MRVLLLTCALVASVSATHFFSAEHFTSEGSAGQVCGDAGIICPPEQSSCQEGTCVCGTGNGLGALACAQDEENYWSSMVSDPTATTMKKERFLLSVPCMFLFSSVVTTMLPATYFGSDAKCHTKFYVYHTRVKGKMFVGGVRVEIRTKDVKGKDYIRGFNIEGRANNTKYDFWLSASKDLETWSDNINHRAYKIKGSAYVFTVETQTNRARLIVPACGFHTTFRPADAALGKKQKMLPGIMIEYLNSKNPAFDFNIQVIALPPNEFVSQATGSDLTPLQEFTIRGFKFALKDLTYRESSTAMCNKAIDVMNACPIGNLKEATENCQFILDSPNFVRCYSRWDIAYSSHRILNLYSSCVEAYCSLSTSTCQWVQNQILNAGNCVKKAPVELMNFNCEYSTIVF